MNPRRDRIERVTQILSGELFKALGFRRDGTIAGILSPLVRKPIENFSKLCIGFDERVVDLGFQAAAQWIMPNFASSTIASGSSTIPSSGPLLIASNHPGAHDSLVIASHVPRDDLKIIVNIPFDFITEIPATLTHFLYAPHDTFVRMKVVREAINHLKAGGALLMFASGRIDPDPTTMPGAEYDFSGWSRSLDIMLRKVPKTNLVITIVSNILHPQYVQHIFTKFQKERPDKQRISEFFQVMNQMRSPKAVKLMPRLSLSKPLTLDDLMDTGQDIMDVIQVKARQTMALHLRKSRF